MADAQTVIPAKVGIHVRGYGLRFALRLIRFVVLAEIYMAGRGDSFEG